MEIWQGQNGMGKLIEILHRIVKNGVGTIDSPKAKDCKGLHVHKILFASNSVNFQN